jgi:hypothetical protein
VRDGLVVWRGLSWIKGHPIGLGREHVPDLPRQIG